MKQAERNKSDAAPEQSADASMAADASLLPDAEYVEQLLAMSPSAVADGTGEGTAQTAGASEQSPRGLLCLPAQCLLRDAVEYRQHLLSCLPEKTVVVDVVAVERIDAAFMQVLLAFVRSRPRDSEPVTWLNVNAVFVEAARLLGVQTVLALPEAA